MNTFSWVWATPCDFYSKSFFILWPHILATTSQSRLCFYLLQDTFIFNENTTLSFLLIFCKSDYLISIAFVFIFHVFLLFALRDNVNETYGADTILLDYYTSNKSLEWQIQCYYEPNAHSDKAHLFTTPELLSSNSHWLLYASRPNNPGASC